MKGAMIEEADNQTSVTNRDCNNCLEYDHIMIIE